MWKSNFFLLLILNSSCFATTFTETPNSGLPTQTVQTMEKPAAIENFLQLEQLLTQAIQQKRVSAPLIQLAEQLTSADSPLNEEAQWLILKAKMAIAQESHIEALVQAIQQFVTLYPQTAKRHQVSQFPFALYTQYGKYDDLLRYAQTTAPLTSAHQCDVLTAKLNQVMPKLNTETADTANIEKEKLLQAFEQLWQNTPEALPENCAVLEQQSLTLGFQTIDKLKQKAVLQFTQNRPITLSASDDESLVEWLNAIQKLRDEPQFLPNFVENQPLDAWNKAIIQHAFNAFIKTQPEQTAHTEFSRFLQWAEKFQLTAEEINHWKLLFLNRTFDNDNPAFKQWRDEQILTLRADNLTERRLRMAIWQKTDLKVWLETLSAEARNKQEWRYWQAIAMPEQQSALLELLSQERGFYPMLAAFRLNKPYQVKWLEPETALNTQHQPTLKRIHALRELKRFEQAKSVWVELLQAVDFEQKLALSTYAHQQHWYDLSVEGTIQAKAWDYLPLRLPNAYQEWFQLHLQGKSVTPSFAMAIARQESAWNAQARSHANALGLMQLLPSTAKQTADKQHLPFTGEQDLLNPFTNIMLGTAHLEELNQKYPNNRILIAAAYNAGTHRVERWLKRANGKLAMDEFIASIPFLETRGYVQNVLAYDYYYQRLQQQSEPMMFSPQEQQHY